MTMYHPDYRNGRPIECANPAACNEGDHADSQHGSLHIYERWLAGQMQRAGMGTIPTPWTKTNRPPRGS